MSEEEDRLMEEMNGAVPEGDGDKDGDGGLVERERPDTAIAGDAVEGFFFFLRHNTTKWR